MVKEQIGIVGFEQLRVRCLIGTDPHEKEKEQEIFVDVRIEYDWSACLASDCLTDTIDYRQLADLCNEVGKSQHHGLLEFYAKKVADRIFKEFPARHIWIRVSKPHVLPVAKDAYVEYQAKRA